MLFSVIHSPWPSADNDGITFFLRVALGAGASSFGWANDHWPQAGLFVDVGPRTWANTTKGGCGRTQSQARPQDGVTIDVSGHGHERPWARVVVGGTGLVICRQV